MPELPDIVVYVECLMPRILNQRIDGIELRSPFVLRSVDPPLEDAVGARVCSVKRMGKRIVVGLEGERFLILHLMIAGRLRWRAEPPRRKLPAIPGKIELAVFRFPQGCLHFTEAGSKKRASLHLVRGAGAMAEHDRGGLEVLDSNLAAFRDTLVRENHTLKRALTDPHLFSGIGNAYSDEILHAARLSPMRLARALSEVEIERLHTQIKSTLQQWIERLRAEAGDGFPEKVTAFREGMAVHGRYRQPCPVCGSPVQRIVYADNEANYCARCQTGGKLLADRSLSRLLREDWPRTLE